MPQIGEVRKSKEIGYGGKCPNNKWIWADCEDCGKERWVLFRKGKPNQLKCRSCAQKGKHPTEATRLKMSIASKSRDNKGDKNPSWKGGKSLNHDGYILVKVQPDEFFYPMAFTRGYVLEHRLVMAKSLGRNLHSWEIVHHKHTKYPAGSKEDKQDNKIENLQLVSDDKHKQITLMENRIRYLEGRVMELEIAIVKLSSPDLFTSNLLVSRS